MLVTPAAARTPLLVAPPPACLPACLLATSCMLAYLGMASVMSCLRCKAGPAAQPADCRRQAARRPPASAPGNAPAALQGSCHPARSACYLPLVQRRSRLARNAGLPASSASSNLTVRISVLSASQPPWLSHAGNAWGTESASASAGPWPSLTGGARCGEAAGAAVCVDTTAAPRQATAKAAHKHTCVGPATQGRTPGVSGPLHLLVCRRESDAVLWLVAAGPHRPGGARER